MSKFDAILRKIEEQTGTNSAVTPQQQSTAAGMPQKPVAGQPPAQQQTPQPQAIQQAAKLLGMDPKALEQLVIASQQQQKPPTNNQPAQQSAV
jgi:hypothetical protein